MKENKELKEEYLFDDEYLKVAKNVFQNGYMELNKRTMKKCLKIHGDMMKFDLSNGKFPLLTLRQLYPKGIIAELLGFIRGYDNAKDFRNVGCNFWDANANESDAWLKNPYRKGEDDLGRIYGVQARSWRTQGSEFNTVINDQLKTVVDKITNGIDDRRLIVTHWNPAELDQQALPPCHIMYMFGLRGDTLDLSMIQRSCDLALGVPSNIVSYALLLMLIAQITGKKVGTFTHFMWNVHIYEDQLDGMKKLIKRESLDSPTIEINPNIKTLEDLETWVSVDDFVIKDYKPHPPIKFPFTA